MLDKSNAKKLAEKEKAEKEKAEKAAKEEAIAKKRKDKLQAENDKKIAVEAAKSLENERIAALVRANQEENERIAALTRANQEEIDKKLAETRETRAKLAETRAKKLAEQEKENAEKEKEKEEAMKKQEEEYQKILQMRSEEKNKQSAVPAQKPIYARNLSSKQLYEILNQPEPELKNFGFSSKNIGDFEKISGVIEQDTEKAKSAINVLDALDSNLDELKITSQKPPINNAAKILPTTNNAQVNNNRRNNSSQMDDVLRPKNESISQEEIDFNNGKKIGNPPLHITKPIIIDPEMVYNDLNTWIKFPVALSNAFVSINNHNKRILAKEPNELKKVNNANKIAKNKIDNKINLTVGRNKKPIRGGKRTRKYKGGNIYTSEMDETKLDEIKNIFFTMCNKFNLLVNKIMTTPTIFKINSLSSDNFLTFYNDPDVQIKNIQNGMEIILDKKSTLIQLMSFVYVNCTDIKNATKGEAKNVIMNEFENKKRFKQDIIKLEQENVKMISSTLGTGIDTSKEFYMHIKKFTSVMMYFVNNYETLISRQSQANNIQNFYIDFVTSATRYLVKIIELIKIIEQPMNNSGFKDKLDNLINSENSSKIITYLKLTNRDLKANTYNKRFKLYVNSHNIGENIEEDKTNMLIVKYNDDNFSYYNPDDITLVSNEVTSIEKGTNVVSNNGKFKITGDAVDVFKYKSTYMFGKFMKIFLPNLNNKDIADEMQIIQKQALRGKPIFMLGYGASGAGKTSSLIYFNKGANSIERQGILVHLCNIFGNYGYTKLEVTSKEFFMTKEKTRNDPPICMGENKLKEPTICFTNRFAYTFNGDEFKLDQDYPHYKNIHTYRSERSTNKDTKKFEHTGNKHPFNEGTSLGETMIYLIDTDRFVKSTTNNPNSSRSHVLVFVKLINVDPEEIDGEMPSQTINFIVGDFAGVENRFQCEKPDVFSRFLTIPRDDGSGIAYYSTEPYGQKIDPIDGGSAVKPPVQSVVECKPEYITVKDPIYDFTNIQFRESMIKFGPFNKEKGSIFGETIQKNVLKKMISNLLLTNTDLNDLTSNEITYKFLSDEQNMRVIKTNYENLIKQLDIFLKPMEEVIKEFLCKYLLGVGPDNIDDYKGNMNELLEKMRDLKKNVINANPSADSIQYIFASAIGDTGIVAKNKKSIPGDGLDRYKPNVANDKKVDSSENFSAFGLEIKLFRDNIEAADTNIEKIIDEILGRQTKAASPAPKGSTGKKKGSTGKKGSIKKKRGGTKKKRIRLVGGGPQYNFYSKDKQNSSIPIKRTFDSDGLVTTLNNTPEFFGRVMDYIKFAFNKTKIDKKMFAILDGEKHDDFVNNINTTKEIYKNLWDIIQETNCRVNYGKIICESRAIEGDFINDSLREIRNTIKEMLIEKNKNVLYNSPEYIDACLETYCPNFENCFELNDTQSDPDKIPSSIFNEIMVYLNEFGGKEYKSKKEFYKEIVVSVFCVFNISRQANNPPPTPYIDINRMKQLFYYESIVTPIKRGEFIKLYNYVIGDIKTKYKDKVSGLLEIKIKNNRGEDVILYEKMEELIRALTVEKNVYELTQEQADLITKFIVMIDNSNAVSAIGTLEFLDQMAKFNTVNTVCSSNSPYLTNDIDKIIDNYGMKEILSVSKV